MFPDDKFFALSGILDNLDWYLSFCFASPTPCSYLRFIGVVDFAYSCFFISVSEYSFLLKAGSVLRE